MSAEVISVLALVLMFVVATWRDVNMGVLGFVLAALVGAGALGLVAYEGFAKPIQKIGQSAAAGLSIVFLAIVLDRITQAWGRGPDQPRRT